MRIFIAAIVLVLASGKSFAKEVVCSGTGEASSISTVPRDVQANTAQDLGLVIDSMSFVVGYFPRTEDAPEHLTIGRRNRSDGSIIYASGSTSGTVAMTIVDAKSNKMK